MTTTAYLGADIFDGRHLRRDHALLLDGREVRGIVARGDVPGGVRREVVEGGVLLPGFVDLQVNGGGGVMFNDAPTCDGVAAIAAAHHAQGTRSFLPTLISDTPAATDAAIEAVAAAVAAGIPGVAGLHLEGPHLARAKAGAHDPARLRPMTDADEAVLVAATRRLPNLMVTIAPEQVPPDRIARLSRAGVILSLGHSDCTHAAAEDAFAAGARCVTHLFNAMSQMGSRTPGLVGAALRADGVAAGLIADGHHVHPASIGVALGARRDGVFLVTDAMAVAGTDAAGFDLNGRRVTRDSGRLTLDDGTLAGADLDMATAIRVLIDTVGIAPERAYAMATSIPAAVLRDARGAGTIAAGTPWTGIHVDRNGRRAAFPVGGGPDA